MAGKYWLILLACVNVATAFTQSGDSVLFKVDDIEVPLSEFKYIYEKNNREGADYTRESLDEYLDLYNLNKII